MELAIITLIAYVIGATPFGYLAGRLKGIDIREHGSGNIGATNVLRTLGKPIGITVFILDFLKGFVPVALALQWTAGKPSAELAGILAALGTILGHNFTFWLKFKGGKGIATSAGALVGLMPWCVLIALVAWLVTFRVSRYVALASIVAAIVLPLAVLILGLTKGSLSPAILVFSLVLSALAVFRHRTNIKRLREGTENRFVPKSQRKEASPS